MPRVRFWLRWSGRDLRQRWIVVAAIALLIAVGTGVYASLASLLPWQTGSYDANFAALHTHDLRVALGRTGLGHAPDRRSPTPTRFGLPRSG